MRALALALALLLTPACAGVLAFLPKIVNVVSDAILILEQIQQHVDLQFAATPNADLQSKVNQALSKARSALNAVTQAANGAQEADDGNLVAAFDAFRQAYAELLVIVAPFKVQTASGVMRLGVEEGILYVPAPLALRPL